MYSRDKYEERNMKEYVTINIRNKTEEWLGNNPFLIISSIGKQDGVLIKPDEIMCWYYLRDGCETTLIWIISKVQ